MRSAPLQPQVMNVGVHRGLDPGHQAEEAARRGRQRRERLRTDAQLAERAREPGRGLRRSPAGPSRRRAARRPGRAARVSRAAADVPARRPPPAAAPARGARGAEPTARLVLRKWLVIGPGGRFRRPGSGLAGVVRAAARSRGGPLGVAELPCPRGASGRPHGPSHGLWQRWEPPRARSGALGSENGRVKRLERICAPLAAL